MSDTHYTTKSKIPTAPQRKTLTKERRMQLATTLIHLKNIEEAEIADFVGMSRNNLRRYYNKIYKKGDK